MNLVKRNKAEDPFDLMTDFRHDWERLFNRSLLRRNGNASLWEPEIDLSEDKESFTLKADLPGIHKEDLKLELEGRVLSLKGEKKEEKETKEKNYYASERSYGAFTRMIELPGDVKAEAVKAVYKDGVLEVVLPKTESARAKQVTVEVK